MNKLTEAFSNLTVSEKKEFLEAFFNNKLLHSNKENNSGFLALYHQSFAIDRQDFLNLGSSLYSANKKSLSGESVLNSLLNEKQQSDITKLNSFFNTTSEHNIVRVVNEFLNNRITYKDLNNGELLESIDNTSLQFLINKTKLQIELRKQVVNELQSQHNIVQLFSDFEKASIFKKFKIKKQENEPVYFLSHEVSGAKKLNYNSTTPLDYAVAKRDVKLVSFLIEKGHESYKTNNAITRALTLSLLDRNEDMYNYIYNNHSQKIDYNSSRDIREGILGNNLLTASLINYALTRNEKSFYIFKSVAEKSSPDLTNIKMILGEINKLGFFKKNKSDHLQVLYNIADIALKHNFDRQIHSEIGNQLTTVLYKGLPLNAEELKKVHQLVQLFNYSHGKDSSYCKSVASKLSHNFFSNTDVLAKKELLKTKLNQDIEEQPTIKKNLSSQ